MDGFALGVAAGYGLSEPIRDVRPIARGEQGRVWRLDTAEGPYAVKESFEPQTEDDAASDVSYQEAVLSASTIRMPHPIRSTAGSILGVANGRQIRVYEWVNLLAPDRSLDPTLVGETLAAIHRVRHEPARPVHPWYTDPVGATTWHDLSRRINATSAPFADPFAEVIPALIDLEGLLMAPENLQNCHRDLFADNVLPMASGGVCVIDWENCGLEDPSHELAVVIFDFTSGAAGRSRDLHDAYVDAGGPGRLSGRGDFSMLIAQLGHFFESAAREWLDPSSSDQDRDHAIGRFQELFESPLSVDGIDEMLGAVAS